MRQKPATTSAGVKSPKTVQPRLQLQWYDPITNDYVEIGDQISGTEYDPANVLWGNGWRLPTEAEIKELIENALGLLNNTDTR